MVDLPTTTSSGFAVSVNDPLVPQGVNVLTIETAGGEQLLMTSMRPVPLPGAIWLFGSALAGLALRRRVVATF